MNTKFLVFNSVFFFHMLVLGTFIGNSLCAIKKSFAFVTVQLFRYLIVINPKSNSQTVNVSSNKKKLKWSRVSTAIIKKYVNKLSPLSQEQKSPLTRNSLKKNVEMSHCFFQLKHIAYGLTWQLSRQPRSISLKSILLYFFGNFFFSEKSTSSPKNYIWSGDFCR